MEGAETGSLPDTSKPQSGRTHALPPSDETLPASAPAGIASKMLEKARFMRTRTGMALRKGSRGRGPDVYREIRAGRHSATGVNNTPKNAICREAALVSARPAAHIRTAGWLHRTSRTSRTLLRLGRAAAGG